MGISETKSWLIHLFECYLVISLDVHYALRDASRLNATISWSCESTDSPDKWQVTVMNLTMLQNDYHYHQMIFNIDVSEYTSTVL